MSHTNGHDYGPRIDALGERLREVEADLPQLKLTAGNLITMAVAFRNQDKAVTAMGDQVNHMGQSIGLRLDKFEAMLVEFFAQQQRKPKRKKAKR